MPPSAPTAALPLVRSQAQKMLELLRYTVQEGAGGLDRWASTFSVSRMNGAGEPPPEWPATSTSACAMIGTPGAPMRLDYTRRKYTGESAGEYRIAPRSTESGRRAAPGQHVSHPYGHKRPGRERCDAL